MKDRGFLTFAQNTDSIDYLRLAYLQALSIKTTCKINNYAVLVDQETMYKVTDRQREVFDYVILIPQGDDAKNSHWKMHNEWKARIASPFVETIKLESDMLIPTPLDHWWDILSARDIVFTNQVCDYREQVSNTRAYRSLFDDNDLPDIYAGLYYFKNTDTVREFFSLAESIFKNWHTVRSQILKGADAELLSTDVAFALAVKLFGEERCTLPNSVPMFTHMKGAVQGWDANQIWMEYLYHQFDRTRLTVGFHRQRLPFHYHYKNFVTEQVINNYERIYFG